MKLNEKNPEREFLLCDGDENERRRRQTSDLPESEDSNNFLNSRIQNSASLFETAQGCNVPSTHCVDNHPVI